MFNRYAYTFNDPINLIDPDGLNPLPKHAQNLFEKAVEDVGNNIEKTPIGIGEVPLWPGALGPKFETTPSFGGGADDPLATNSELGDLDPTNI